MQRGPEAVRRLHELWTVFSETTGTLMQDIKTPISQVAAAL